MDAGCRGLAAAAAAAPPWGVKIRTMGSLPLLSPSRELGGFWRRRSRSWSGEQPRGIVICRADSSEFWKLGQGKAAAAAAAVEKGDEWRIEVKKSSRRVRTQALPPLPFPSTRPRGASKQEDFYPRCSPRNTAPQSRDTPPKRDTGIASEKDWGIDLLNESVNEFGTNEDSSTWYRESGVDLGDNGYRCRWARMGGQSHDGSSEWKEMWWEKSDWTGYKELGVEKSGKNAEGDSWWETWQEVLYQDEWR